MEAVRQALVNTPLWVWALLVFLLAIGARALWPTVASLPRLAILPGIFFVWGLTTLVRTFSPTPISIEVAVKPALITDPAFVAANLGLSGLLTGMLVGRFLGPWLKYRAAADEALAIV